MSFTISETWALLSSLESDIKKKIEEISVPLSDLSLSIFRGVLTGFNTAFIISESKRNELVNSDPKSAEIIRPILRGRDIRRYDFSFQNLYVIFAYFGSHMVIPERYPAIYQHLKLHENKLKERGQCRYTSSGRSNDSAGYPGQHHWLELDNNPRKENLDEFSKQKIIWKRIGSLIRFAYDDEGYLGLDSTCMATGDHIKFVSAFLNSIVGNHILSSSPKTGTGDLLISVQALDPIRVPLKAENACLPIIETILEKSKTKQAFHEEEMELDTVLFDYYGFTSKERDFLRKSTGIYR